MKHLLTVALSAATVLMGTTATAWEKHAGGQQSGSDSNLEGSKK